MTETTTAPLLTPEQTIIKDYPLTGSDRCDACGSQAYVHVAVRSSQQELMFCRHHYLPYDNDVRFIIIRDQRPSLFEKPELAPLPD